MNIKLVVFDFDGVFTNGTVTFDSKGDVVKSYNIKDGMAIKILKSMNISTAVLSGFSSNESTKAICKHLKIDMVSMGNSHKLETLKMWGTQLDINLFQIAYMGDDINDIECMKNVGISACPADATHQCTKFAKYICKKNGGNGAIREFTDYLIHVYK